MMKIGAQHNNKASVDRDCKFLPEKYIKEEFEFLLVFFRHMHL
jgi:hypothetical protein